MHIIADENIPFVKQLFAELGEVTCCSGRQINRKRLEQGDVLLVRSITQVNAELLDDTAVRFVGTATIGADHIDMDYLASRGIAFADAAGSNADSVAEYVTTALLVLAEKGKWLVQGKSIGIIGVGNIGSRMESRAKTLGLTALPNDPPLQRETGDKRFVDLEDALGADIITCHVPLTRQGPDATYHLLDEEKLSLIKPGSVLINTSRGAVVDNQALKRRLMTDDIKTVVLDVWENEPEIDVELLKRVSIATPHIAGYSQDGKVNGAVQLYQALCKFLERESSVTASDLLSDPPVPHLQLDTTAGANQQLLCRALTGIYDIVRDDANFRAMAEQPAEERAKYFDNLRKRYPVRREAHNTAITLAAPRPSLANQLTALNFSMASSDL